MERRKNRRPAAAPALGAVDDGERFPRPGMKVATKTPDGAFIDLTVREMFLECCYAAGRSKRQAEALWKRKEWPLTEQSNVDVSDDDRLVEILDEKIGLVSQGIDALSVREANVHQLASALNILIEKRQLLRGRPTAILSIEDRRAIQDVHKRLIEEMERRKMHVVGMTDVTPRG